MRRRGLLILIAALSVAMGLMFYGRESHRTKRERARAEMTEMRKAVGVWHTITRPMPESLDDFRRGRAMTQADAAAIDWGVDPWGNEYLFETTGRAVTVTCLGADGAPGGDGDDEDIVLRWLQTD